MCIKICSHIFTYDGEVQIVVILWLLTEGKEVYEKGMESSKYMINVSFVAGNVCGEVVE